MDNTESKAKMATDVHESKNHTKVLIIGAGIAGVSAAEYLTKNGFTDFKILESTSRIGGRIWTLDIDEIQRQPNHPHTNYGLNGRVEMGANYIHGIERNPIYQIAEENGLLQLRYKDKGLRHKNLFLTESGDEVNARVVKECDFTYGLLIQQCEEFYQMGMPTPYDVDSVGDYMKMEIEEKLEAYSDEDRRVRNMIFNQHLRQEAVVSGSNGLEELSLSEFGCYEELPGIHYTIPPGFQSVLDILLAKVPDSNILLNHVVQTIDWPQKGDDNQKTCVTCENGEKFYADHVIVTMSLGVMKAQADKLFRPSLPQEKLDSIQKLGFGVVDKVYLYFDEPIVEPDVFRIELLWDDQKFEEEERNPSLANTWFRKIYSFEVLHENLMTGWLCGSEAMHMESLSEEEIAEGCRNVLQKFLKKDIPLPNRVIRTRWGNDKTTRGSYCFIQVGASVADVETLSEPIRDSSGKPLLMFAGEATHPSFYSTTHGALLTGHREAKRILDLYKMSH